MMNSFIGSIVFITLLFISGCTNPFAPKLSDTPINASTIGDQRTVDGVFQTIKFSYQFKDTVSYGKMIAPDFIFTYRDYDKGTDNSWGRDQEMLTTAGLFQAAQNLDIVWNEVVTSIGDSLVKDISRGFNLTVVFSPTDILRIDGRVELRLRRETLDGKWMIIRWRDSSNY